MGTYVSSSYAIQCSIIEAYAILHSISDEFPVDRFRYEKEEVSGLWILNVHCSPRKLSPYDIDEIEFLERLSIRFPYSKIWVHRYVNCGGFSWYDEIIENGSMTKSFSYDMWGYSEHDVLTGKIISSTEIEASDEPFDVSQSVPFKTIENEFYSRKKDK